jgi:YD repeat-containing protein
MFRFSICLLLFISLTACGGATDSEVDSSPAAPQTTPLAYRTSTPRPTASLIPAGLTIVMPSPTPFLYSVVKGDTLSSIAQRFHVSLESLMNANPGVQANTLSVGTELFIPSGQAGTVEPIPTAAPLTLIQTLCWPDAAGGSWCLALFRNDYAETIENLSAQFILRDAGGQEIANQSAFGLLDVLPPGKSMPLAVHLASAPADSALQVQVLTAIRLLPGDTRYLPVVLDNTLVSLDENGRTANVSGRVVTTGDADGTATWVLAIAYDAAGNVVGVRRWETDSPLTQSTPVWFDFQVSSVGPPIQRVEFLAESRP